MALVKELLAVQEACKSKKMKKKPMTERYDTSAEWDADMDKIFDHFNSIMMIMQSNNWKRHIKDTDNNFDVNVGDSEKELWEAVREAHNKAQDFYEDMQDAA